MGLKLLRDIDFVPLNSEFESNQGGIETTIEFTSNSSASLFESNQGGIETFAYDPERDEIDEFESNQGGIETRRGD